MSSQGVTRKRPAPGTAPASHSQPDLVPSNYPSANPGSQLSNDQFLQWGQNPSANAFPNPSNFNPTGYVASQDITPPAAPAAPTNNQVARRQGQNQLVTRNRGYEQAPTVYAEDTSGTGGESSAWGESLEQLHKRAADAQRDAQSKRKQIPPFVQKLSRYDQPLTVGC